MIEHGAHHLSLTHLLLQGFEVFVGERVERTVLQLPDKVVGIFDALIGGIPCFLEITGLTGAVETAEVVDAGLLVAVGCEVDIAVQAERREVGTAVGVTAEQLGINTIEGGIDFVHAPEHIAVVIFRRCVHIEIVVAGRKGGEGSTYP